MKIFFRNSYLILASVLFSTQVLATPNVPRVIGASSKSYALGEYGRSTNDYTYTNSKALRQQTVFHFTFDSAKVSEHDYLPLRAHADYLVNHPHQRLQIQGYADERGSSKYNFGLGLRRANAISQLLLKWGVSARQISVISFGKLFPLDPRSTEKAHVKNRRAELNFIKKCKKI